ncbi:MAG: prepilin-type N-terminal cleavage/methylation domain-containing protein [Planctomycetota bacterium]|nr:prepilin-type N-terminal cleavage/methylation domain-containing protein [Planctomycetota bacterium]
MKTADRYLRSHVEPCANVRAGFSLFEVMLSLAIFLAAFVAISQLSSNGMNAAVQARLQTRAVLRCESKLAEIVAAIEPLEDVTDQPFQDDEQWKWSLQTASGPHADIRHVTVSVNYEGANDLASTSFVMTRLLRDPTVFEMAALAAAEEAASELGGL